MPWEDLCSWQAIYIAIFQINKQHTKLIEQTQCCLVNPEEKGVTEKSLLLPGLRKEECMWANKPHHCGWQDGNCTCWLSLCHDAAVKGTITLMGKRWQLQFHISHWGSIMDGMKMGPFVQGHHVSLFCFFPYVSSSKSSGCPEHSAAVSVTQWSMLFHYESSTQKK